ncbi:MAG: hypothetical protein C0603_12525 [Denitrovibrio sp.]|nr:MAG: hypothetical protein C0603_12525 [Denitrovibrio sp.]
MKNILFDLDGTISDPQLGIINCIVYALEKLNVDVPERNSMNKYIGPPLWESFKEMLGTESKEEAHEAVVIYRERFSKIGMFENTPYDGIFETLDSLKKHGYQLFICTSKPTVYAKQIAEHFKFDSYFNEIYGSNLNGSHVEKTELIAHIIQTEKINPYESAMIGDRIYDITGAINNGLSPYGVSYGYGNQEEHKDAITVFNTPKDISTFFLRK